jgi:short-subunit dehydrogenase involved in D-alanine esterification of teichoic acids
MFNLIRSEPVRFIAAIQATIALAVLFGLELSADQVAGIVIAVSSWLAFVTRNQVSPVGPDLRVPDDPSLF